MFFYLIIDSGVSGTVTELVLPWAPRQLIWSPFFSQGIDDLQPVNNQFVIKLNLITTSHSLFWSTLSYLGASLGLQEISLICLKVTVQLLRNFVQPRRWLQNRFNVDEFLQNILLRKSLKESHFLLSALNRGNSHQEESKTARVSQLLKYSILVA